MVVLTSLFLIRCALYKPFWELIFIVSSHYLLRVLGIQENRFYL